jgi:hypothetical protein
MVALAPVACQVNTTVSPGSATSGLTPKLMICGSGGLWALAAVLVGLLVGLGLLVRVGVGAGSGV